MTPRSVQGSSRTGSPVIAASTGSGADEADTQRAGRTPSPAAAPATRVHGAPSARPPSESGQSPIPPASAGPPTSLIPANPSVPPSATSGSRPGTDAPPPSPAASAQARHASDRQ